MPNAWPLLPLVLSVYSTAAFLQSTDTRCAAGTNQFAIKMPKAVLAMKLVVISCFAVATTSFCASSVDEADLLDPEPCSERRRLPGSSAMSASPHASVSIVQRNKVRPASKRNCW